MVEDQTVAAASDHAVVGAIPQQPPGFQPRPHFLWQLNRDSRGVSVLTGPRGVGKTELAGAYARAKLAAGWRLVAWINAGDIGSLLGGLAAVAEAAELSDGSDRDAADAGQAVRRWLEADGNQRLLVFDDADDPDVLRPFIPANAARVLVTSTRESVAELGTNVPVGTFSRNEALAVMAGRTALDDEAGAMVVSEELGYLPLTVTQAATTIAGQHLGYRTYLDRLRVFPLGERLTQENGRSYPPGVAEAVLLSLDEARASDQTGICARVAEVMAVMSAGGVRRDMLHTGGQAGVLAGDRRGSQVSATLVDRALERLAERSLLTFSLDSQVVIAHGLVLQVMRDELVRRKRLLVVYRAVACMLDARAATLGAQDRPIVRDLIAQLMALLDNIAWSTAEVPDDVARMLLSVRSSALYYLNELGDSPFQAVSLGEQLVADLEWLLGPDHPDTLGSQNNLATACQAAGRAAEAISLFRQTFAQRKRLLGPDHPDTLTSQNNLAASCRDVGRVAEAIGLFEQTLIAREQVLGADHANTMNSRRNLADAYQGAGRAAEAILLFEQALAVGEQFLGPNHPATLRARNDLAAAYRDVGRDAEAIRLFEQAVEASGPGAGH